MRDTNRKYLLDVIKSCKTRDALYSKVITRAINLHSYFYYSDWNITKHLDGQAGFKYTHHGNQNELLYIIACHVSRKVLAEIRKRQIFGLMADEYTDIGNSEQSFFCILTASKELDAKEHFLISIFEIRWVRSEKSVSSKYSPKREKLIGNIVKNIEDELFDQLSAETSPSKLEKLHFTRWTVRAVWFKKIDNNHTLLLKLWEDCLKWEK